jgi:hypothetical protein
MIRAHLPLQCSNLCNPTFGMRAFLVVCVIIAGAQARSQLTVSRQSITKKFDICVDKSVELCSVYHINPSHE